MNESLSIFDQDKYLELYQDVKDAIENGQISSGYEHYENHGKYEGRHAPKKLMPATNLVNDIYNKIKKIENELNDRRIIDNLKIISKRLTKKKIILFYSHKFLEGNIKQSFFKTNEIIRKENKDIECHLLTLDKKSYDLVINLGYSAIFWDGNNSSNIKKIMSAAVVVDEGFFVETAPTPTMLYNILSSAYRINLWHGTPMRLIGLNEFDFRKKIDYHHSAVFASWSMNNVLCSSSGNDKKMFDEAMVSDRYEVTGYARNDIFYRDLNDLDMVNVDKTAFDLVCHKKPECRVIYYAPTWREDNPKWVEEINLESISKSLHSMGYLLIVNLHPFEFKINMDYLYNIQYLTLLNPDSDTYPILKNADLLITDYSSIIFDFLHTQKPIILFRPDHESYISNLRQVSPDRDNCINSLISKNSEELVQSITSVFDNFDISNVNSALYRYHEYHDAKASERCANIIIDSCQSVVKG
ncbi:MULTISPECIES: CDP-glycerol glycerophosphotransferase family protein [Rahnella]|uniref:CDP-glycerol glycerophosphotransferase family protein n=1 Tax=Rahnella laticis TaxID=2787622 RepID=A0ABS0E4I3_9GAMM|nr:MULTISPECIES: CDP-glycerol glycerophosphotransferase family protein [Rahnella]MBF7979624.1 CDP-glycerol glycerophosphotransferase family protein [Rahnella laticis]MBF7999714.1 CDP-glycerol glycerophosphotransferase family protein [Rahnella sp. LAC-M12]